MVDVTPPTPSTSESFIEYLIKSAFPVGGAIVSAIEAITGTDKDQINEGIATILKATGANDNDVDRYIQFLSTVESTNPVVSRVFGWLLAMASTTQFIIKSLTVGGALVERGAARIIKPNFGDPQSLLNYLHRNPQDAGKDAYWSDLGIADRWQKIIEEGSRPFLDVGSIQQLWARYGQDGDEAKKRLAKIGFDEATANALSLTFPSIPSMSDLMELYRRGKMQDDESLLTGIKNLGFNDSFVLKLKGLAETLPQFNMLAQLYNKREIQITDVGEGLLRLGYNPDLSGKLISLIKTPLNPQEIRTGWLRGYFNDDDFERFFNELGYYEPHLDVLKQNSFLLPTPSDLIRMLVREVFTPEIAGKFGQFDEYPEEATPLGKKVGFTEETMKQYWAAHWDLPAPGQGFDMFHRGIINYNELSDLLKALDVMPYWRDKIIKLNSNLIPRRVIPKLIKQGIIKEHDAFNMFFKLGYGEEESAILAKSAFIDSLPDVKSLTKTDILNAFKHGEISESDAINWLHELGYEDQTINFLITVAEHDAKLSAALERNRQQKAVSDKAQDFAKEQIIIDYLAGVLSRIDAKTMLTDLGYIEDASEFMLEQAELKRYIDDLEFKSKQIEKMFKSGAIDKDEASDSMVGYGFVVEEVNRRLDNWILESEADRAISSVRDRLPTKSDVDSWLKLGIIDSDQFIEYYKLFGYPDETIANYVTEITLKLQNSENKT